MIYWLDSGVGSWYMPVHTYLRTYFDYEQYMERVDVCWLVVPSSTAQDKALRQDSVMGNTLYSTLHQMHHGLNARQLFIPALPVCHAFRTRYL